LEKNRDVEFWNEFKDLYKFWDSAICSGNIMMLFDFIDVEEIYEPAPKSGGGAFEDIESKVDDLARLTGYEYDPSPHATPSAPPADEVDEPCPPYMVITNHKMSREEANASCYLGPFTEEEWDMLLCGEACASEADICRLIGLPYTTAQMGNTAGYPYQVVEDPSTLPPQTPVKCPHLCAGCNGRQTCELTVADFIAGPVQRRELDGLEILPAADGEELPLPPSRAVAGLPAWMEEEEEYDEAPIKCGRRCPDCHGSGCGLVHGDFQPYRRPTEISLTPPPFYMTWQMFRLGAAPSDHCEIQTNTRTVEFHREIADEMTHFVGHEYPGWKRKGRLDYWCIYDRKGKELHLDELPPLVLTRCSADGDLPLRAYQPPRPRLTVDDLGRISELTAQLTDDAFPLRVEFYQEEEDYDDSLLLTLKIASEQSRKEWRKNAIEERLSEKRRRECCDYVGDYGPNEDW